jgi:hypothetical protein
LTGLTFTQSITASVDPALWSTTSPGLSILSGTGPAFTDTVTVNGHTLTFTAVSTDSNGYQLIFNQLSRGYGLTDDVQSPSSRTPALVKP